MESIATATIKDVMKGKALGVEKVAQTKIAQAKVALMKIAQMKIAHMT